MSAFLLVFAIFLSSSIIVQSYIFDSVAQLESLVDLEHDLGQKLKAFVNSRRDGFEKVEGFVKVVENETNLAKAQGPDYVNNPVNAFSIIKRFTDHWTKMDVFLQENEKKIGKISVITNLTHSNESKANMASQ